MPAHCCSAPAAPAVDPAYRRALWVALAVNAGMFAVELVASWSSGSVALLADSIDFFGDAANYALSLAVVAMALPVRSRAALFKAACMGAFGVFVFGQALWRLSAGLPPEAFTMGAVGFVALLANAGVAWMLYRFRTGDSNMRSVWIPMNPYNPTFKCGNRFLLVSTPSDVNKGTRTNQDSCPGCTDDHIENYTDVEYCTSHDVGDLGVFWTIQTN